MNDPSLYALRWNLAESLTKIGSQFSKFRFKEITLNHIYLNKQGS